MAQTKTTALAKEWCGLVALGRQLAERNARWLLLQRLLLPNPAARLAQRRKNPLAAAPAQLEEQEWIAVERGASAPHSNNFSESGKKTSGMRGGPRAA